MDNVLKYLFYYKLILQLKTAINKLLFKSIIYSINSIKNLLLKLLNGKEEHNLKIHKGIPK